MFKLMRECVNCWVLYMLIQNSNNTESHAPHFMNRPLWDKVLEHINSKLKNGYSPLPFTK